MKLAALALCALSGPAFADFQCTIERQCGGGTCEAFDGGPLSLQQSGDSWFVALGGTQWQAFAAATIEVGGEVSLVIPPQDGMSGLVTVLPDGKVAFTAHAGAESGLVAITGEGQCTSEGG